MSEDLPPRPLEDLLTEAREGRLSVNLGAGSPEAIRVNAEEFVSMERDCERFKLLIRALQRTAQEIWKRERWDLGENSEGLTSADVMVNRFRTKAQNSGDGNDVHAILEQHYQIVEDIQEMHRVIAQRYTHRISRPVSPSGSTVRCAASVRMSRTPGSRRDCRTRVEGSAASEMSRSGGARNRSALIGDNATSQGNSLRAASHTAPRFSMPRRAGADLCGSLRRPRLRVG
ncbi:hypothetical protein [Nocardia sp. NPDC051750]|uniref:hypothetical protein n=1 Tax=Nocardia sp. NPDC051750 TaxID=3364325 RepID=UPI003796C6FF